MQKILEPLKEYLPFLAGATRIGVVLLGGYVLTVILNRMFRAAQENAVRLMVDKGQVLDTEMEKRARTVITVIRRPVILLVWVAVVLMGLQELGFRVEPLLAGAGVSAGIIGVAVGFGAQTLIKDMIAGIFMLAENQIRVGDVAVINGTGGLVEEINLRTTVLRAENGAVHIFPNGSVQTLANLTREYAYYVLEVTVRFEEDTDRVAAVLQEIAEDLRADSTYGAAIAGPLEVMGVDRFLPSGVVVKARLKTFPQRQWFVGREMNRRIQQRFGAEGILQPETNVFRLEAGITGGSGEDLKAVVREVLKEMGIPGAGHGA